MQRISISAAVALCSLGCAGAAVSMVVKPPLQSQCQRLPIQGCSELVDGVLLYVQGDEQGALKKILMAKDKNVPAQLKPFAKALRDAASLPGAEDYAKTMNEIADIIDSTGAKPSTVAIAMVTEQGVPREGNDIPGKKLNPTQESKPQPVQRDPATRALSATADFGRIATGTVDLSLTEGRAPCKVAGQDALCVKVREGAIVITDVIASRACPDRLFIGATLSDSPAFGFHWQFEVGSIALTGARLSIAGEDWLQVAIVPAKKGVSNSSECFVTWSGFRPWIVSEGVN